MGLVKLSDSLAQIPHVRRHQLPPLQSVIGIYPRKLASNRFRYFTQVITQNQMFE